MWRKNTVARRVVRNMLVGVAAMLTLCLIVVGYVSLMTFAFNNGFPDWAVAVTSLSLGVSLVVGFVTYASSTY